LTIKARELASLPLRAGRTPLLSKLGLALEME
jgi:hypothetical protein